MDQQQITHIALEIGQLAGAIAAALTFIPAAQAPTWVPVTLSVLTGVATWAKQEYGNTPQNVPGSTAAAIAAGTVVPVKAAATVTLVPGPVAPPAVVTPAPAPHAITFPHYP